MTARPQTDEDNDLWLDERKLAAFSVVESARDSGWFTDAELDAAMENSGLLPAFALKLDRALDGFKEEMGNRPWPLGAVVLHNAFNSYLAQDINILSGARDAERRQFFGRVGFR